MPAKRNDLDQTTGSRTVSKDSYYNTPEARLDTVLGDHKKFFDLLRRIRSEYEQDSETYPGFSAWLLERYGIELVLNSDGRITAEHYIRDRNKYLICRLKFPD
jgi:hypothetical protein